MGRDEEPFPEHGIPSSAGFGGLWSQAWRLYALTWRAQFLLFAPLFVALFLVQALFVAAAGQRPTSVAGVAAGLLLGFALPTVIGSLLFGASHLVMTDRLIGREVSVSASLQTLGKVRAPVLQGALLSTVLVMMSSLIPFLGLIAPFVWGPPILVSTAVLEGGTLGRAWSRTRPRMRGQWTRVLLFLMAISVCVLAAQLLLATPLGLVRLGGTIAGPLLRATLLGLYASLTLPYLAAGMLVAYFDARVRVEDFSIEELAAERSAMIESA